MANVLEKKAKLQSLKKRNRKKNSWLLIAFLICSVIAHGQKKSDQLQAEQSKLEKKLSTTKNLLEKVKSGTQNSMNELKLIDNQVKFREELVQNFDNQIRGADLTISSKDSEVKALQSKLERLKAQYKKLLLYAYKHRNRYGKMMYIFSASNYFEAVKRNSYLKRIAEIQDKQFKIIKQNQGAIKSEISTIRSEKSKKERLLSEKIIEKEKILKDKEQKQKALDNLRKDEKKLMAELKKTEKQKDELKRRIKQAIEKELADAEAKAKKEAKKTESGSSKKTESGSSGSSGSGATTAKKEVALTETKESIAMGKNFESNRGKLPWPVAKGTITEGYGKNPHPTMANVYTNNNGIDIGAPKNAQVRAVFEGEVTSVLNIPGAGKVVIIKHGNYRTVYSNLQDTYVSVGSKVTTKQTIGSLLPDGEGSLSTSHFEIHQVVDGSLVKMNPTLWLSQ
ncbi:MAG TPA: peptidoglycan DD-metalloendopeptidase family protein [Fluviicola sp.]|nr:peptidoglycan DD-metalloendopeptidase family protein [Fluviicola sp.]